MAVTGLSGTFCGLFADCTAVQSIGEAARAIAASGPGRDDPPNEIVGPRHGLLDGRQHVESVSRLGVQGVPLIARDEGWRPELLLPVVEETSTRRGHLNEIELLALVEELEIDQVPGSLTS